MRLLGLAGYVCLAAILLATLFQKRLEQLLPLVHAEDGTDLRVSIGLVLAVCVFSTVGWAFLIAGTAHFRALWRVPIAAIFIVAVGPVGNGAGVALCLTMLGVSVVFSRRRARDAAASALLEVLIYLSLGLSTISLLWASRKSDQTAASTVANFAFVVVIVTVPIWLMLALEATEAGMALGRRTVALTRRIVGDNKLWVATLPAILLAGITAILLDRFLTYGEWGMPSLSGLLLRLGPASVLLLVATGIRLSGGRSRETAASLQVVSVTIYFMFLVFRLGLSGSDPLGAALEQIGILPSALVFVGLVAYNVLSFGRRFANNASPGMPRDGRILAYFGVCLLVTSSLALLLNEHSGTGGPSTAQDFSNGFTGVGIVLIGLPYLLWMVWKKREELAGLKPKSPVAPGAAEAS